MKTAATPGITYKKHESKKAPEESEEEPLSEDPYEAEHPLKESKKSKKKKDKKKGKKSKHDKPIRHEEFGDFEDHF